MGLVSEVIAKVRLLEPGTSGRWDDALLGLFVHAADCAIKENGETLWASQDITLRDEALYYILDKDVVAVRSVEFSLDGTNFDDGVLKPTSYRKLDALCRAWKDDRGTQPEHYLLLGAPGVESYSRIMIWRPIETVDGEKIRVNYIACQPDNDSTFTASTAPDWVQDAVYVPYVMALIMGEHDQDMAMKYWQKYLYNIALVRSRYGDAYGEGLGGFRGGGPTMTEGYL